MLSINKIIRYEQYLYTESLDFFYEVGNKREKDWANKQGRTFCGGWSRTSNRILVKVYNFFLVDYKS